MPRFPQDFDKQPHASEEGYHWRAEGISVIGGAPWHHGDGVNTFEAWFPGDEEPIGHMTAEEINLRLGNDLKDVPLGIHLL